MSRLLSTNRSLEKPEPYEGKLSRTVLRGERSSNAPDLPDRPSDLEQRNGRAVRKGNEIAKLYADNKVDVIIYAVEKSLDSYKFNLLHNKQMFIQQLKSNKMGSRTIDEGSMDESSGMNFSEYMAILSGNTDLLEKAKLEKKIASLESERHTFNRSRSTSKSKLDQINCTINGNREIISRIATDNQAFISRAQVDADGNKLNPIQLKGVDCTDVKAIGAKLTEISEKARTHGQDMIIGTLYGFNLIVKTESSTKELFDLTQNKFFVEGEGRIKYSHNNGSMATDPKLASLNFLNALEKIPKFVEKYESETAKIAKDIPVLQEIVGTVWRKEDELKALKLELSSLQRKIQLTISDKTEIYYYNSEGIKFQIPEKIKEVQLTTEQQTQLAEGQEVFIENLLSNNGQKFSSFAKVNLETGIIEFIPHQKKIERNESQIKSKSFKHSESV